MKVDKSGNLLTRSAIGASFGTFVGAFSLPGSENILVVPLNLFFHAMFCALLLVVGWRIWKINIKGAVITTSTSLGATIAILLAIAVLMSGDRSALPINFLGWLLAFTKIVSALLLWPFLVAIVSGYAGLRLNEQISSN